MKELEVIWGTLPRVRAKEPDVKLFLKGIVLGQREQCRAEKNWAQPCAAVKGLNFVPTVPFASYYDA